MKNSLVVLKQLDEQLLPLKEQGVFAIPKQGWVRTIRKALGMTIKQLAKRLGVDPSRVVKIETSEIQSAVTLHTLESIAEAYNCRLVYCFVPKISFEETIKEQARKVTSKQIKRTAHTMDLEAQSVDKKWLEDQEKDAAQELLDKSWKHLWEE